MDLISNYEFTSIDYVELISRVKNVKTLLFVDPPYYKTFSNYSETPFTLEDQLRLATSLATSLVPTIATNSFEDEIISAYRSAGFDVFCYMARRTISRNGNRERVKEMIAFKNIPTHLVQKMSKKHNIELIKVK
jgi:site-specific DNA-adenine methylase